MRAERLFSLKNPWFTTSLAISVGLVVLTSVGGLVLLKAQLQAFASDTRRDDISQQMRNIARRMTPEEMD